MRGGCRLFGRHEQPVVPAADLFQRITERAAKIGIGGDDLTKDREFDDRLRTRNRRELAGIIGGTVAWWAEKQLRQKEAGQ